MEILLKDPGEVEDGARWLTFVGRGRERRCVQEESYIPFRLMGSPSASEVSLCLIH